MTTATADRSLPAWRPSVVLAGCAALASAIGFKDALLELASRWDQQEQYSYGYLIPFISLWLLWSRRGWLAANMGAPHYAGVALIAAAMAMGLVGELSAIFILSQVGFVLSLMGIALALGGIPLWRVASIPIAYLLFAIPLPYFIDAKLTLQLQLISSELGVFFINLFQIPVYLEGNIIDLGSYKLQVVEACAGLRYLYPLLSLSFLAAYLFAAPLWQRAVVFLSSAPIAIVMNGVRIGAVGVLVDGWGVKMAEGVLHALEGWVIFVICAAMLAAEMAILSKLSNRAFSNALRLPRFAAYARAERAPKPGAAPLVLCLALLCAGAAGTFLVAHRSEIIPPRSRFATFPMQFSGWSGKIQALDWATEKALKLDDYVLADYRHDDGRPVSLYVAYYTSQRKNESPHSPVVCLPGSGWLITRFERKTFAAGDGVHPFNRVIIQNGSSRTLVYYWFEERGRSVADEYEAKWRLLVDSIAQNRSDGALVRLSTEIGAESDADADRRIESLMQAALPDLWSDFLPAAPSEPGAPLSRAAAKLL